MMVGYKFLMFAILAQLATSATLERKKKEHPGCFVWWFAPDCFMAKWFGVDPFGIYPWEKFCKKYSSFENKEVCKKYVEEPIVTLPIENIETEVDNVEAEEDVIKPRATEKVSKRRSSKATSLMSEMCEADASFAAKHVGLCANLKNMK